MKKLFLFFALAGITAANSVNAQDTIRFTWEVTSSVARSFMIDASYGKTFVVNWGDGIIETKTGIGSSMQSITHAYTIGTYDVIIAGATSDCLFTALNVDGRRLTVLDVQASTALEKMSCCQNQLNALDLSKNTALTELWCYDNHLTTLDVSANTVLTKLICYDNQLTTLNVAHNPLLTNLSCSSNQLTTLDVSHNPLLIDLSCGSNSLTTLDLNHSLLLEDLSCSSNQLTTLNLSANTALRTLKCQDNHLQLSDLFAASKKIPIYKYLGTQTLLPITVTIGNELFVEQSVFDGIYTNYSVTQNGTSAPQSDYAVTNGKIKFNKLGNYTVTMTNSAINSVSTHPAKVIVDIEVVNNTGIVETDNYPSLRVYPNPTSGQLIIEMSDIEHRVSEIQIFDVVGRKIQSKIVNLKSKITIDISHLPNGMYYLKIDNHVVKFVKE